MSTAREEWYTEPNGHFAWSCRIEEFPSPPTCGPCKDSLFRECADVSPVPPDIPGLEPFSPVKNNMIVGKKYCHERNYYNPAKYDVVLVV